MDKKQQEFLKRLRETFRVEADEHLRAMSAGVLKLEKGLAADEQAATVEVVFREAHSLKGAARAVNLVEIERVCQSLESVFSAAKRGEISLSLPFYDRLHDALTLIGDLLSAIGAEPGTAEKSRVAKVTRELGEALRELPPAPAPTRSEKTAAADPPVSEPAVQSAKAELPPAEREIRQVQASAEVTIPQQAEKDFLPLPETVRISTAKLNSILLEAEEMLSAKLALGQRVAELWEAGIYWHPGKGTRQEFDRNCGRSCGNWRKKATAMGPEASRMGRHEQPPELPRWRPLPSRPSRK